MSDVKRIDPRRPYRMSPTGLRRIVLGEIASADPHINAAAHHTQQAKPLRTREPATRWHMAIAHSYRGRLDDHAREAIAAAAILATPETGVVAVILGELHENAGELGADKIVVVPGLDTSRFQPQLEETVVQALLDEFKPAHVFMPDNMLGDGDLGRRLISKDEAFAATHVIELDARHVTVGWSGGAVLADAPLPRFVLLVPGTVDAKLPFTGGGDILPAPQVASITEACRDLGLEATKATDIALEEADFIVSAGNGVQNVETLETR